MKAEIENQDNNRILIYTSENGQVKIEVRHEADNLSCQGKLDNCFKLEKIKN